MIDEPFTYVERKTKKKNNNRNRRQGGTTPVEESLESLLSKTTATLASSGWNGILLGSRKECDLSCLVSQHQFLVSFLDCLRAFADGLGDFSSPCRALCLGLGSPMSSTTARAQLDTLIALCSHFSLVRFDLSLSPRWCFSQTCNILLHPTILTTGSSACRNIRSCILCQRSRRVIRARIRRPINEQGNIVPSPIPRGRSHLWENFIMNSWGDTTSRHPHCSTCHTAV